MPKLSIVVLNYNTKDLTLKCVDSIVANTKGVNYEIIVVDNGSMDSEAIHKLQFTNYDLPMKVMKNEDNLGFAGGNNSARKDVKGEYVLFLNSDTEVNKDTIKECVKYMDAHGEVGAMTCKIILPNGKLDPDVRRSFPTPWVALTHFSGLDRVFPKSRIFSRYWYGYKSPSEIQEVDVLQGAFFLTRRRILDEVNWFDESYFLDGEDIDLSWKIKETGRIILYYPKVSILHIKKASKKRKKLKFVMAGVAAMEIFYKKHLWERYPLFLNLLVLTAIYLMKVARFVRFIV